MRKNIRTSTAICGRACGELLRLLHRAVAGCAGRYHRPYRTYAVIYHGAIGNMSNCLMAFTFSTGLRRPVNCLGAVKHGLNDVERAP